MCSVSYLCRFLPYCLQLVSYPYFITDCLSSVSLSFFVFFCIQLNLISLYCWDLFQKIFASNSVYCLTLIHINTHYTIQYIYTHTHTHTHTQRHVRTQLFCFILYYISISLILTLVTRIMKILWNERSQKKKLKKKKITIPWYILLSWYRISHIVI